MSRWIAMHCGEEIDTLQERHPNAFLLLCQIARRARWKDCAITGLAMGEAFIGDWKTAGLPSKKAYQVAKSRLEKCGLVNFRGGNRGTRATLMNSTIFSLSQDDKGPPEAPPRGTEGEAKGNRGGTIHTDTQKTPITPIEDGPDFQSIVGAYPRRENIQEALRFVSESVTNGADPTTILIGTRAIAAVIQQLPSGHLNAFVPGAAKFFKNERWRDDPQTWLRSGTAKNGAALPPLDLGGRKVGSVKRFVDGKAVTTSK